MSKQDVGSDRKLMFTTNETGEIVRIILHGLVDEETAIADADVLIVETIEGDYQINKVYPI